MIVIIIIIQKYKIKAHFSFTCFIFLNDILHIYVKYRLYIIYTHNVYIQGIYYLDLYTYIILNSIANCEKTVHSVPWNVKQYRWLELLATASAMQPLQSVVTDLR